MCKAAAIDKQVMAVEFLIILNFKIATFEKPLLHNSNLFVGKLYSWFSRSIDVKIDEL